MPVVYKPAGPQHFVTAARADADLPVQHATLFHMFVVLGKPTARAHRLAMREGGKDRAGSTQRGLDPDFITRFGFFSLFLRH